MQNQRHPPAEDIVFTKQPYVENIGPRGIKEMKFTVLSGPEIMRAAECQVHLGHYYDMNKKPVKGGLLDPRLGPPNKDSMCRTCGGSFNDCPGHFGYLNLALPVFNIGFLGHILDILKCICKSCSRILLEEKLREQYLNKMRNPKTEHLKKADLMKSIVKKCSSLASSKAVKCSRCSYLNGMVKKAGSVIGITHDRSRMGDKFIEECRSAIAHTKDPKLNFSSTFILNPVTVLSLFKRIPDEDCELLYLHNRPESLIITSIPVPPNSIRPSRIMDDSQSHENDITERLKLIIQDNASLRSELQEGRSGSNFYLEAWDHLQVAVALYVNSETRVPFRLQPEKQLSGLVQRLKGKQGRFRGTLSGKRVEYTGRTVISPDPNLKITEVAIPIHMARLLSYPERVSDHNIEKLRQCVSNGPHKYPGAKLVKYPDGSQKVLMGNYRKRIAEELKCGCIVDRHLEDGDIVLFNRQPSLHRMSIMCHRARIMPWRTLRFNESVCNPYNADFDGDEMNLHVPQTEEARTEALMLMGVQHNLCTPKNGEVLIASTQDFLTSSFLITRKDTFYDRSAFSLMCSYMDDGMDVVDLPAPAILKPIELWTGKQLFSVLLRTHANIRVYLNLVVKEKTYSKPGKGDSREKETKCPNDGFVYIRNSELICGQLGKATLGNGNKDGLYSVLFRDYNAYAAAACMNRLAKLSARWIGNHGFSIGIDDVQPGMRLNEEKGKTILNGYQHCDKLIQEYSEGKLALKTGCDAIQTLEAGISETLNKLREEAGDVCMKELHWRNSPLIMSQCGSKGSPINISQMIACVGQQSVGGRRAPDGFIDRSLPHFPIKSKAPAAKGFVANSFYSGLTATEFFFHTMGGREGLVDTAVKTAETGYMSRRLIKGLEDLSIQYDNTVRNARRGIVQFVYGDDGLDPAKMEGKGGQPFNFDRLFMKVKATCAAFEDDYLSPHDISGLVEEILLQHDRELHGDSSKAFKESLKLFLGDCVKRLESALMLVNSDWVGNPENTKEAEGVKGHVKDAEKVVHKHLGISKQQLKVFLKTCIYRYLCKKIEPGTTIGVIGAQSIGEPGTQMTLKTFHFAGVASMNITQGVPRIKEIINAAKKISTPLITAELQHNANVNAARIVKGRIQKTLLGQVAKSIKIVMASRSASVVVTLDMKTIEEAQLSLDANIVKESILKTPRTKLKDHHIKVLDNRKLEVIPQSDRKKVHAELYTLKKFLPGIVVQGITTVDRVIIAQKKHEGFGNNQGPRYNMFVEGTGLRAVMGTEGVDGPNTVSNHVAEVYDTLGIEAARKCIIDEIRKTMESHGMSIDIRHMMLLADLMTFKGEVLGITRFGVQKMDRSTLMLASFERTSDHLFNASVSGRIDGINGVSECIIMGVPMRLGTGILSVQQSLSLCRNKQKPPLILNYGPDPILS